MAFADPIKFKPDNTTEVECPKVNTGNFLSEYLAADGLTRVKIFTTNGRRRRHEIRVVLSKMTTDPFDSSRTIEVSTSIYLVVDKELVGFTNAELKKAVEGFVGLLSASAYAAVAKLLGSES